MKSMKLQKTWILAIVLVASVGLAVTADRAVEREGLQIVAELAGTKTQVKHTGGGLAVMTTDPTGRKTTREVGRVYSYQADRFRLTHAQNESISVQTEVAADAVYTKVLTPNRCLVVRTDHGEPAPEVTAVSFEEGGGVELLLPGRMYCQSYTDLRWSPTIGGCLWPCPLPDQCLCDECVDGGGGGIGPGELIEDDCDELYFGGSPEYEQCVFDIMMNDGSEVGM